MVNGPRFFYVISHGTADFFLFNFHFIAFPMRFTSIMIRPGKISGELKYQANRKGDGGKETFV